MKITNFEEWNKNVTEEYTRLADVSYYLNEKGLERMHTFESLSDMGSLCYTASELLKWIESGEYKQDYTGDIDILNAKDAKLAISCLRTLAHRENSAE